MAKILTSLPGLILAAALAWAAVLLMNAPRLARSMENAASGIQANQVVSFHRVPQEIGESYSDAVAHHGIEEAARVRNCFTKGGADLVYRQTLNNRIRFHLLCREENGIWADRIIEWVEGKWEEFTAFEPKGGTQALQRVLQWLASKGATRIKTLPW